jgi:hypothetical protein
VPGSPDLGGRRARVGVGGQPTLVARPGRRGHQPERRVGGSFDDVAEVTLLPVAAPAEPDLLVGRDATAVLDWSRGPRRGARGPCASRRSVRAPPSPGVDAYRPEAWQDLAVATVGATAALTGLLFVAVSINLDRVLEYPWLPRRAAATLTLLLALLAAGVLVLVPGQPVPALAAELGATGLVLTLTGAGEARRGPGGTDSRRIPRVLPAALVLIPAAALLAAAATLVLESGGGLYWLAGALVGGIAAACCNAWVLLVEIRR